MTDVEILRKAIQKAAAGGWKDEENIIPISLPGTGHVFLMHGALGMPHILFEPAELIFDHGFAKALWGEEPYIEFPYPPNLRSWQYHLREMVVSDDPIRYLGEHM